MFKKTLLATAISAIALNATAGTLAITGTNVSQEGAANETSVAVPTMTLTAAAEYAVGDILKFNISGASFDTVNSTPVLTVTMTALAVGGADVVTAGLLSQSATEISYRITSQTDSGVDGISYIGATFALAGMEMTTATVVDATGDISVAYSAETSTGLALDAGAGNTDVAQTVVAQFSSSVTTAADGIIDVNNSRKQFTVGPLADTIVFTPVEAVAATHDAAFDVATYVINGDFSWMESDGDAGIDAAELAAATTLTTSGDDVLTATINAAGDAITVVATDGGANAVDVNTVQFDVLGVGVGTAPVLPTQTFTADTTITYTPATGAAATKSVQTAEAAGSWTLNGKVATINYMPFGDNTQVIMRATNTGVQTGDLTVRYMLEGVDTSWNDVSGVVTSLAPGVSNISDLVMNAIKADAGVTSGKVAIEITANVPTVDATVYAAYKVVSETDRGFVGNF